MVICGYYYTALYCQSSQIDIQIRMSSHKNSRIEEFVYGNVSIQLHCDMSVGIGGDKWPAADLFCKIVSQDEWSLFFHEIFDHKRCIELGSGTGIAGILIEKLYSTSELRITDQEDHISHIQGNITMNKCTISKACIYDWISPPEIGKYDIILAFEW